ncbi:K(+)/H(+) antiporter NhaP2 [Variibacter gotjawalensis]|uniref:K(+)/H(+) antiporter NhaP2 n=1 Tax=Variibacter gotjawalensis TaxID=1333996 RepID=A0A0S3Q0H0_9BRAD|nr:potassium/proton antiporter [Variibacter gotjawalensis]NIK47532.1 cell volume regulation protein A [Variibacter gotjawalensis]RZS49429.1 potassium/proton antiporter (CPA1 family) [Variibacter gotjawalensis]BAT61692.1 K(+)/H(+) antiporter NhaP2 [Variibacter gotjawalensis]
MASIDAVSLTVLLGAVLVLAGILSSLIAMRFGAPLLFIFLIIGIAAGEQGIGGIKFNDVSTAYAVGIVALALILFDGGLRTRMTTFRSVLGPAGLLATIGVLITATIVMPVASYMLGLGWIESLLIGAVIASTDAAAVFFLLHAGGLRLRPRVGATLEVESSTNDPFAIFLTIMLVEILVKGGGGTASWLKVAGELSIEFVLGGVIGVVGGRLIVWVLNRLDLPQGLHAPFVATGALVVFGVTDLLHGSGYLAAYAAGLVVGNRPTRAHNTVITFMDAVTWLAQIVMFVILGLLVWPGRLPETLLASAVIAVTLMFVARPAAVFLCLQPFRFSWREKVFVSWVGLRGAVGIFLASIPLLVSMPKATIYFDVAFVVVLVSLLVQGWSLTFAANRLGVSLPRIDTAPRRVELDLPGQLEQELVGYAVTPNSLFRRQGLIPSWAKLMLVVRDERVHSVEEAGPIREQDYVYFLAPPEKAQALDRFFVNAPAPASPDSRLLGDFYVPGDATLAALAEIYGVDVPSDERNMTLADFFASQIDHPVENDRVHLGSIELIADRVTDGRVITVGLDLVDPEAKEGELTRAQRVNKAVDDVLRQLGFKH